MPIEPKITHLRTFQNGDRVVIPDGPSSRDLPCRTGVVEDAQVYRNGGLVRHDDGTLYGWAFHEMRDEKNPDMTNSTARVSGERMQLVTPGPPPVETS